MHKAYYNENDKFAAQWLRNLIAAGHIVPGEVDERSIVDVKPDDLKGYTQHHFFAGIGGWSAALRLAGWPDDKPIWTGSCPCQPFSAAGKRKGFADERHLWPEWKRLIAECRPAKIFGEQVKRAITMGWLDKVFDDLEEQDYACASSVLRACGAAAANEGARIYFTAEANEQGLSGPVLSQQPSFFKTPTASSRSEFSRVLAEGNWEAWQIKSGVCVFADGIPGRVGGIKAYGNAIDPFLAAAFIRAAA